jgi:hypothetical protein
MANHPKMEEKTGNNFPIVESPAGRPMALPEELNVWLRRYYNEKMKDTPSIKNRSILHYLCTISR